LPKPRVLGIEFGHQAAPVRARWLSEAQQNRVAEQRLAKAKLKSLRTFETRARSNPLAAGDPVEHDRWPKDLVRDYGTGIPNLFRFELAERWRGYYSLVGEPGGCRIWVLYLWDHEEYSRQSGYAKK
jgi:hypothetical protein